MSEILNHLALVVCLVGGLLYVAFAEGGLFNGAYFKRRPDSDWHLAAELGRLAFFAGLLGLVMGK